MTRSYFFRLSFTKILLSTAMLAFAQHSPAQTGSDVFDKKNLVAWCIVPFDSKNRTPVERAAMLRDLGIRKLAYDWRDRHIPEFDAELDALQAQGIQLQAFWLLSGLHPESEKNVETVFRFLKRRNVHTQIWYLLWTPDGFDTLSQVRKLELSCAAVAHIARRADSIGCTVGLYNHNKWFGETENELAILQQLKMKNIGLVYNFNHAQDQIAQFPVFFPTLLPHLLALNLAGLRPGDQRIYPLGRGDSEKEMIELVWRSGYRGPVGIINEDTDPDARVGLEMNLEGLKNILLAIGDTPSANTY